MRSDILLKSALVTSPHGNFSFWGSREREQYVDFKFKVLKFRSIRMHLYKCVYLCILLIMNYKLFYKRSMDNPTIRQGGGHILK